MEQQQQQQREEANEVEVTALVRLCIESATQSKETIDKWRRQRRTLEKMPTPLAEALFNRLLRRRLLTPSLLEVFQHSVERVYLRGENFVDAEWMAYLGAFRYLNKLNLADCRSINSSALWAITGMECLKELDLSRCVKVTDAGIVHLLSIPNLEKLGLSETGLTVKGVKQLSSLINLTELDLGGLPVTDVALSFLEVLKNLEYLDLWGSKISNNAAASFKSFLKLSILNLAWTGVTEVPNLPNLTCLNMSNCTINSIFREGYVGAKAPHIERLHLAGAIFTDSHEAFSYIEPSKLSFFDLSNSSLDSFWFLAKTTALEHLDLSFSRMDDDSVEWIAYVGATLTFLNLSNTRLSSAGVGILAGNLPNIKTLLLSHTAIDDVALSYIGMMPSLRALDLSNTNIQGFQFLKRNGSERILSLTALKTLNHLEMLALEDIQLRTEALKPLSSLKELKILSLKSDFLIDYSFTVLSSLLKLKVLGIRGAVLTNSGLHSFHPPSTLEILDLRGCWLLTADALSSFHQHHTQIELRHEHDQDLNTGQNMCAHSSTAHGASRITQLRPKRGKMSLVQCKNQNKKFVDERLKYTRQELLKLQFSPLAHFYSHGTSSHVLQKTSQLFCTTDDL